MLPVQVPQTPPVQIEEVVIVGRGDSLLGLVDSSTQGVVGAEQLAVRPWFRPGDVLESVPGVIVTQHSGAGKANQFFLRGFNLDHGTDLRTSFEGVAVNQPTHGHGQGYTDLNFLIPELVESVSFRKGPYYADIGDFGSAGAVDIRYVNRLESGIVRGVFGADDYARGVIATSERVLSGEMLVAFEAHEYDGPWTEPDDYRRFNGVAKWSRGTAWSGASVVLHGMDGEWNATDQIPKRARVDPIAPLGRFDSLDPTDGGRSNLLALTGEWHHGSALANTSVRAGARHTDLDLWSNFTYFLDDSVNGDQFQQTDRRMTYDLDARHEWIDTLWSHAMEHSSGVQIREDHIDNGLFRTAARTVLSTTREDEIDQLSIGLWYQNQLEWAETFRTIAGVRADLYTFDVDSDDPVNSGEENDALASAKLSLVFGPWFDTELYLNGGQGFHSNDARGVTTTVDPSTNTAVSRVDPLVRTEGAELGVRTTAIKGLQSTLSLWILDSDSEILFVGDAGTTEASRPSRRFGLEFANYWAFSEAWSFDVDAAWSRARFRDDSATGDHVPGALRTVLSAGVTWLPREDVHIALRGRHFGPRDLTEDASVRSSESTLVNLQSGWRIDDRWSVDFGVFNLFDEEVNDIEYFYDSQLPGEAQPVSDIHFHPAEGRTLRFGATARW